MSVNQKKIQLERRLEEADRKLQYFNHLIILSRDCDILDKNFTDSAFRQRGKKERIEKELTKYIL